MEVPGGHVNKKFVVISEIAGTAFIMMAINWGGTQDASAEAGAMMYFILYQLFGDISGAHFNPAVTLAVLFKEGSANWMRNFTFAIMLIICQGIGGLIGTGIAAGGFSYAKQSEAKKISEKAYGIPQLCPSNGCNDSGELMLKVFICEAICTFLFISYVLMVKKHNGAGNAPTNSLTIGIILYLATTMASGISGGCLNPVVGFFQSNFQKFANTSIFPNAPETSLIYVPAYIFGPMFGGFVAGMWHTWIHGKAMKSAEDTYEEYLNGDEE